MKFTTMSWQHDCEEGYYCVNGKRFQCPEGTFNNKTGALNENDCMPCLEGTFLTKDMIVFCEDCNLNSCLLVFTLPFNWHDTFVGYYCPSEDGNPSTSSMEIPCGDVNKYCPNKSPAPLTVDIGYYSIGDGSGGSGEDDEEEEYSYDEEETIVAEMHRTNQKICPKGSYCEKGRKFKCPAGTYGNRTGLLNKLCSGFCPGGYFCREGSAEPEECPRNSYATPGNWRCIGCNNPLEEGRERCRTSRQCCTQ